ncbi:MAG: DUF3667 domain-containing protein [Chryseobacterium sp.]|nr:DUF3667 domain-containing protein [Chryseobacterium sp.]MBP7500686.1 DUF3667 domain-containing protein [Chryseobacterium sp.]
MELTDTVLICKNCNSTINQNFCSHCGQKKYKRIDRKYLVDEVQYLAIHTNKGFFYSIKNIIRNPGKTALDFINGNRVNHYKPLYLAFLLCGFSAFISYQFLGLNKIMQKVFEQRGNWTPEMSKFMAFYSSYNSFIMLLMVPVFAIFTSLAFRKWGQNYYEHVIMNAFFQTYYTLISIVITYPIYFSLRNNTEAIVNLSIIYNLIIPLMAIWFYKGFYPEKSWTSIILKTLLVYLLAFVAYIFVLIFVLLIAIAKKMMM